MSAFKAVYLDTRLIRFEQALWPSQALSDICEDVVHRQQGPYGAACFMLICLTAHVIGDVHTSNVSRLFSFRAHTL
jgi:hypothetical protein